MTKRATAAIVLATTTLLAGCGGHHTAAPGQMRTTTSFSSPSSSSTSTTTTTTIPTTVAPSSATTALATTTTTTTRGTTTSITTTAPVPPTAATTSFPLVINQAMATFQPVPAGAEAPLILPSTASAVSAQATGLGGTDTVTLISTPTALPVNDTNLSAGHELASFSTTPAASASSASTYVTSDPESATCAGSSTAVTVSGLGSGISCPTLFGPMTEIRYGNWQIQVQGATALIASWITTHGLPMASAGLVQIAGQSLILWANGPDVYQVRTPSVGTVGLQVADSMRPWRP